MAAASSTNSNRLVGSLDEIVIYNSALTAQEAIDHYNVSGRPDMRSGALSADEC